ncbi:MAG TPA: HEAT repeat domain-containing protein [Candidatus Latescibacteria bacterium]|nr:HEAT repeat domain-containing protein [Candidatus Latescibacterota bacterium]
MEVIVKRISILFLSLLLVASCGRRPVEEVVKDLDSPDDAVRKRAAQELIMRDKEEVVPALLNVLRTGSLRARYIAIQILGRMRDPRVVEPIKGFLSFQNAHIRAAAAQALGNLKAKEALGALEEGLKDTSSLVREKVAWALGKLDTAGSLPSLRKAIGDPSMKVRRSALVSLAELYPKLKDAENKGEVLRLVRERMEDPAPQVRYVAVQIAGILRDRHAVPLLIERLEDPLHSIRQKAAHSLGDIGDPRAIPYLKEMLSSEDIGDQEAARWALRRMEER